MKEIIKPGPNEINHEEKIGRIIDHFGFEDKDLDYITENLWEVLLHYAQEGLEKEDMDVPVDGAGDILDVVYSRLASDDGYEEPVAHCAYFTELLVEIGGYLGSDLERKFCKPDYLRGYDHWIAEDKSKGVYRDPSIYREVFSEEVNDWIPIEDSEIDRNDVSEEVLNLQEPPEYWS